MHSMPRSWIVAVLAVSVGGCTSSNSAERVLQADPGTGLYQRSRNPKEGDRAAVRFRAAYDNRDPAALRETFADALALCEADGFDASESVGVAWLLQLFLARFGDKKFATALGAEAPRTQAAVGYQMVSGVKWNASDHTGFAKLYPQTDRILTAAPEIDWPVEKAIAIISAN